MVGFPVPRARRIKMAARHVANRLFVARLPWTACKDNLAEHFSQFGKVISSKVIYDMKSGRSKKFGFVFFADEESCAKAFATDEHHINDQKVVVEVMTNSLESSRRNNDYRRNNNNRRNKPNADNYMQQ